MNSGAVNGKISKSGSMPSPAFWPNYTYYGVIGVGKPILERILVYIGGILLSRQSMNFKQKDVPKRQIFLGRGLRAEVVSTV